MIQKLGFNPWISMWTSPRRTIRAIVDSNPKQGFFYIGAIVALQQYFSLFAILSLTFTKPVIIGFVVAVLLSPIIGCLWFFYNGAILFVCGKLLKGKANYLEVCSAYAWSQLPVLINLLISFSFI